MCHLKDVSERSEKFSCFLCTYAPPDDNCTTCACFKECVADTNKKKVEANET